MKLTLTTLVAFLGITSLFAADGPQSPRKKSYFGETIGTEDRVPISVRTLPWSPIVRITFLDENGQPNGCTGTMVSEDVVLTNAHCVKSAKGIVYSEIKILAGVDDRKHTYMSTAKHIWAGTPGSKEDWAVIKLRAKLGKRIGYFGIYEASLDTLTSPAWQNKLVLAGYSGDYRNGNTATAHVGCSVVGTGFDGSLTHDCDSNKGSSGAGLFAFLENGPYIVALNYGQLPNINYGVEASRFLKTVKYAIDLKTDSTTVNVCNDTSEELLGAVAFYALEQWISRGWYKIESKTCSEIPLPDGYNTDYYNHAQTVTGRKWGKHHQFCVTGPSFTIGSKQRCNGHYEQFTKFTAEQGELNPITLQGR